MYTDIVIKSESVNYIARYQRICTSENNKFAGRIGHAYAYVAFDDQIILSRIVIPIIVGDQNAASLKVRTHQDCAIWLNRQAVYTIASFPNLKISNAAEYTAADRLHPPSPSPG